MGFFSSHNEHEADRYDWVARVAVAAVVLTAWLVLSVTGAWLVAFIVLAAWIVVAVPLATLLARSLRTTPRRR